MKIIFVNQSIKEMTLDDLKLICEKANIPFKNQNIGGLLNDLQTKYFKPKREHITEELKQLILKEQNYKCNTCNIILTEKYELDHIKPVSNGGGNDRKNLNMLCVPCHREKLITNIQNILNKMIFILLL